MTLLALPVRARPGHAGLPRRLPADPGLKLFRFPTRFLIVVELGLALLAAIGLDAAARGSITPARGSSRVPAGDRARRSAPARRWICSYPSAAAEPDGTGAGLAGAAAHGRARSRPDDRAATHAHAAAPRAPSSCVPEAARMGRRRVRTSRCAICWSPTSAAASGTSVGGLLRRARPALVRRRVGRSQPEAALVTLLSGYDHRHEGPAAPPGVPRPPEDVWRRVTCSAVSAVGRALP